MKHLRGGVYKMIEAINFKDIIAIVTYTKSKPIENAAYTQKYVYIIEKKNPSRYTLSINTLA
jgi:hypothetical protein